LHPSGIAVGLEAIKISRTIISDKKNTGVIYKVSFVMRHGQNRLNCKIIRTWRAVEAQRKWKVWTTEYQTLETKDDG